MDDICFLRENHPGSAKDRGPDAPRSWTGVPTQETPKGHKQKKDQPTLMNGIAFVKNECRRDRHCERGQVGGRLAKETAKKECESNTRDSYQDGR